MPAVLIHGVPDTFRVWEPLRKHLQRSDVLAPSLPGFGTSRPAGFSSTKEEYVTWIIKFLENLGTPVDLIGHDWGCILTARVASLRPDLIRTWAAGSGPVSASYDWHALAKIWQTPGEGERWMADLKPEELADFMTKAGLPHERAEETVSRVDDDMKQAILSLYRSAVRVGMEWQPDLQNVSSPGLVFWGKTDSACPLPFARELGANTLANQVLSFDAGHWVIVERSAEVAQALEAHWAAASKPNISRRNDEQA